MFIFWMQMRKDMRNLLFGFFKIDPCKTETIVYNRKKNTYTFQLKLNEKFLKYLKELNQKD